MADECIQIMGGMGFMKVQSIPRQGGHLFRVDRHISTEVSVSSCVPGTRGGACAPRYSNLPDL